MTIDVLEEVHDRDTVLVPYGWHGPCVAAPGFDMYYLNVMAGPGAERAWKISDHPDQAWVREHLGDQPVDPRLTFPDRQEARDAMSDDGAPDRRPGDGEVPRRAVLRVRRR